ncbi:MAG TPA: HTTM domain-containing protein, partial [Aequorivita sp.]|nr:HTTM domain-containing protein [Aequorivita sp.]
MLTAVQKYFKKDTQAAPLAVFRVLFGFMMALSILRFWANGWIEKLYIQPKFFFSYYGFEWVKPIGDYTYIIFIICGIAALFVALGYKYRMAIIVFFLSFTYIELMDKTTYLNHYYFISCIAFLMIFLPANVYFSVDTYKNPRKAFQMIPKWTIDSIKLMLGIVYFYAGLAKLNSDWLFNAMPLKIWLPSKYDLPFLGDLMQQQWVHYTFSWSGALYDLAIPFLLLYRRTRWFAFALVVIFHVMTRVLFPIGMFPYIMIVSTLIFFGTGFHRKVIRFISKLLRIDYSKMVALSQTKKYRFKRNIALPILAIFFVIQLLFPWRYLAYPNELFWTEEGYRFS